MIPVKLISFLCIMMISLTSFAGCAKDTAKSTTSDLEDFFYLLFLLSFLSTGRTSSSSSSSGSSCSDSCSNSLPCCSSRCCTSVRSDTRLMDLTGDTTNGVSKCSSPQGALYACTPSDRKALKLGKTTCTGSGRLTEFPCDLVTP